MIQMDLNVIGRPKPTLKGTVTIRVELDADQAEEIANKLESRNYDADIVKDWRLAAKEAASRTNNIFIDIIKDNF